MKMALPLTHGPVYRRPSPLQASAYAAQLAAELKLCTPQGYPGGPSRQSSLWVGPHLSHRPRAQTALPALGWQLHDTARQLRPGSGRERSSALQDSNARLKSGMIRKFVRVRHSICALPNPESASEGTVCK